MIGNKVAEFRKEKGKSLGQVAKAVGADKSHLSKIESCKRWPGIKLMFRLAKYFNFGIEDLFFENND